MFFLRGALYLSLLSEGNINTDHPEELKVFVPPSILSEGLNSAYLRGFSAYLTPIERALHGGSYPSYNVGLSHAKVLLYALKKSFAREQNFISKFGNNISSLGNNISNLGNNISSLEITFSSREKRFCHASKMIFCRLYLIF